MDGGGESDSCGKRVTADPTPFPRGVGGAAPSRGRGFSGRSKGDDEFDRGGGGGQEPSPGMDYEVVTADMQLGEGNKGKRMLKGMGWEDGKVGIWLEGMGGGRVERFMGGDWRDVKGNDGAFWGASLQERKGMHLWCSVNFEVHVHVDVDVDVSGDRDVHVAVHRYDSKVTHSNAYFLCTHSSVCICVVLCAPP